MAKRRRLETPSSDDLDRIQAGVEHLDQDRLALRDQIGTDQADISAADIQHLDDVARLEQLDISVGQRDGGAVGTRPEGQCNSSVAQQTEHAVLHTALGQGQPQQGGVEDRGHEHSTEGCPAATDRQKRRRRPGRVGVEEG